VNSSPAHHSGSWRGSSGRSIGLGIAASLLVHLLLIQIWRPDTRGRVESGRLSAPIEVRLIPYYPSRPEIAPFTSSRSTESPDAARPRGPLVRHDDVESPKTLSNKSYGQKPARSPPSKRSENHPPIEARAGELISVPSKQFELDAEVLREPKPAIQGPQNSQPDNGDFSEQALEQFRRENRTKRSSVYRAFGNDRKHEFESQVASKDYVARLFEKHLGIPVDATYLQETINIDGSRMARVKTPLGEYCLYIPSETQALHRGEGLRLAGPSTCNN
jgi:hypothetical protein